MGALESWGKVFEKIADWIPGRVERWKNQLEKLQKEREGLLKSDWTVEKGRRLERIDSDISKLNQLLKNKAS